MKRPLEHVQRFIGQHPRLARGLLGFALLGSVTLPPAVAQKTGIAEDTTRYISAICSGTIDENGVVRGILPEGPYGGALDLFLADEGIYYDWLEFMAKSEYSAINGLDFSAVDTSGPAFRDYYENTFLPLRKLYDPEMVDHYVQTHHPDRPHVARHYQATGLPALSEVPVYGELHGAFKSTLLAVAPGLHDASAHAYAHAAIGNLMLLMRASALILPQVAQTMGASSWQQKVRGKGHHPHLLPAEREALAKELAEQGLDAQDIETLVACGESMDTETFLARLQATAQGRTGKVVGALGLIAVAASAAPAIGMGVSYYAGMAGMEEAIPHIAEATGMVGHDMSGIGGHASGMTAFLLTQANSHLATCILPAVSAAVLGMADSNRRRQDRPEDRGIVV